MILCANINHLDQIFKIEEKVFKKPWTYDQIKYDLLKLKDCENLVYIYKNEVVGYILGTIVLDEFNLNNIAVKKKQQSNGFGKMLIENLIFRLINKKIKKIFLEVSIYNFVATNFYKSIGFKSYGVRKNYYSKGDHALLFDLEIKNYG